jgi:ABC-type uncharacterized transport system substrate-binding protein
MLLASAVDCRRGYVEGQNVTIVPRCAEGDYDALAALARELVVLNVAVLVAVGGRPSALAARKATATIPIVFIGPDPVRAGRSLASNRRTHATHVGKPGCHCTK